jgi:hypothetical protein
VLDLRLSFALTDRNWPQGKELIQKMKSDGEDDGGFAYGRANVPVGCYSILLDRLQGEQPSVNASFAEAREQLNQKGPECTGKCPAPTPTGKASCPGLSTLQVLRLSGSWCSLVSGLGALVYKLAAENATSLLRNVLVCAGTKIFPSGPIGSQRFRRAGERL